MHKIVTVFIVVLLAVLLVVFVPRSKIETMREEASMQSDTALIPMHNAINPFTQINQSTPIDPGRTTDSGSIINNTKKITGTTSHKKRVAFGTHNELLKYSPDTGKNLAFTKIKMSPAAITNGVKRTIKKDAEKLVLENVLSEDLAQSATMGMSAMSAATSTSIEDIILGTAALL